MDEEIKEEIKRIDHNTSVPLFVALAALPFIAGGVLWLATIDSKASASLDQNEKQDIKIEKQTDLLLEINGRVIRIEELLKKEK